MILYLTSEDILIPCSKEEVFCTLLKYFTKKRKSFFLTATLRKQLTKEQTTITREIEIIAFDPSLFNLLTMLQTKLRNVWLWYVCACFLTGTLQKIIFLVS